MRFAACSLLLVSLWLVGDAVKETLSGHVDVTPPRGPVQMVERSISPEEFRNLMNYQWVRAAIPALLGLALLRFQQRRERLDPLSAAFQGMAEQEDARRPPAAHR